MKTKRPILSIRAFFTKKNKLENQLTLNPAEKAILSRIEINGSISLDEAVASVWTDDGYWLRSRVRRLIDNMKSRGLIQQVEGKLRLYEKANPKGKRDSEVTEIDPEDHEPSEQT